MSLICLCLLDITITVTFTIDINKTVDETYFKDLTQIFLTSLNMESMITKNTYSNYDNDCISV